MRKLFVALLTLFIINGAQATTAKLISLQVNKKPQQQVELIFNCSQAVQYRIFTLDNPVKLIIDFTHMTLASQLNPVTNEVVQNVRSSQKKDGSLRVVIDLAAKVQYSDNAVFLRDKSICQYWHYYDLVNGKLIRAELEHQHICKPSELTIDHVMPVSRGGKTNDFTNAVCACRYCNEIIKKNQTPEEAGLRLIRIPKEPKRVKGDIARSFFVYNPNKPAHKAYNEFINRRS